MIGTPMRVTMFILLSMTLSVLALPQMQNPEPANGSGWNIYTVDAADDVGLWTSLALDVDGCPHIAYFDWTNADVKYARWTGSNWSI
ncbi:MAG: hypothetical protein ACE5IO_09115, partial [Thermoplasmata archaeon]